jgi:hypothetical protein
MAKRRDAGSRKEGLPVRRMHRGQGRRYSSRVGLAESSSPFAPHAGAPAPRHVRSHCSRAPATWRLPPRHRLHRCVLQSRRWRSCPPNRRWPSLRSHRSWRASGKRASGSTRPAHSSSGQSSSSRRTASTNTHSRTVARRATVKSGTTSPVTPRRPAECCRSRPRRSQPKALEPIPIPSAGTRTSAISSSISRCPTVKIGSFTPADPDREERA